MALSLGQYKHRLLYSRKMENILKERLNKQAELSKGVSIDVGNHIPENLIIEILSWLPVRTLLQFKTVCKQ
ncbi:hypothetical protein RND81_07G186200 [Saponaria officinalis]|uniref:F-box domain-containing protein n=1 Tax=Saponaria officinalis TaxID=3572 RepID=A0AAW1JSJ0_SAPOF